MWGVFIGIISLEKSSSSQICLQCALWIIQSNDESVILLLAFETFKLKCSEDGKRNSASYQCIEGGAPQRQLSQNLEK